MIWRSGSGVPSGALDGSGDAAETGLLGFGWLKGALDIAGSNTKPRIKMIAANINGSANGGGIHAADFNKSPARASDQVNVINPLGAAAKPKGNPFGCRWT